MKRVWIVPVLLLLNCTWNVAYIFIVGVNWWLYGVWLGLHTVLSFLNQRNFNEYRRRKGNYRSTNSGTREDAFGISHWSVSAKDPRSGIEVYEDHAYWWPYKRGYTMETKRQEDPIKGWKIANAYFNEADGRVLFTPVVQSMVYEPEGYAKCTFVEEVYRRLDIPKLEADGWEITNDHGTVPSPECTCGFYAMTERQGTDEVGPTEWAKITSGDWLPELAGFVAVGQVLLEVEFFGKIIKAARGVRAEYQRVLCIYSYPPEGKDHSHPLPNVQVDWKWLS